MPPLPFQKAILAKLEYCACHEAEANMMSSAQGFEASGAQELEAKSDIRRRTCRFKPSLARQFGSQLPVVPRFTKVPKAASRPGAAAHTGMRIH